MILSQRKQNNKKQNKGNELYRILKDTKEFEFLTKNKELCMKYNPNYDEKRTFTKYEKQYFDKEKNFFDNK